MLPTLVLVGRPNVGKSTLFNRLTKTRDALVADFPGLTRDRHYGRGVVGDPPYLVVDTGGFEPLVDSGILAEMAKQTLQAIDEADVVIFLVDGRQGVTAQDKVIADRLRRSGRKVLLAVNKCEGMNPAIAVAEFHALGLGEPHAISSAHGDGVSDLVHLALADFPVEMEIPLEQTEVPKVAIVGRPNVGKSTLVNALLGEERVIAFDQPGTTRDSIHIDFEREGRRYTLVDTAGVRRRGRIFEAIEKFSVIKTLQSIENANVVVLVLDARDAITEQDAHLAAFVLETGRALVVAVNKWDGLDKERRDMIKQDIARKLHFLAYAQFHYVSALKRQGLSPLMKSVDTAYASAMAKLPTPKLTRVLQAAVQQHQPPISGGIRPKLRYAHQGGKNPPIIVIHGSHVTHIPGSYQRFLEGCFRKAFGLVGTPLEIQFKQAENPYVDTKLKPSEGGMTMRRRKNAQRAQSKSRKG
ncbi:MAG: ribosome biogenesis GTPase Der [Methylophilaceae bacterium]|nr:ribosome biogenesis GTPase Der [Methylophilaceae bacterium]